LRRRHWKTGSVTKDTIKNNMKNIGLNLEALAKISKGTKRKKKDINEIEVAEEIDKLYREYGSLNKVASYVKLSPEMVRQIKSLNTLENGVKQLYISGVLKGYDIGYRISKLQEKDQIILAKYITDKNLISEDVRAIAKYKIDNPRTPIGKVISKVIQSKDKKIYVVYLGIEKDTFEKLSGRIKNKDIEKTIKSIFNSVVHYKFITYFELNGRVVLLKLLREGLREIRNKAKELKVPLRKLGEALTKEYSERNTQ